MEWRNLFRGLLMGLTELIPGVSSATIAMILGIYERFIIALNGLTTREWKSQLRFLIPLGLGVGTALIFFSRVIEWLLTAYPQPTLFFFLGLVVGVIPFLLKSIQYRRTFQLHHYLLLLFFALLVALSSWIREERLAAVMTELGMREYLLLFTSGWLASSLMILPGISGALVFLVTGVYPTVVNALYTMTWPVIITVGGGVVIGALITSKLIRYLFHFYKVGTYAAMIGLILGSTVVIYPGGPWSPSLIFTSLATFISGFIVAVTLGAVRSQ